MPQQCCGVQLLMSKAFGNCVHFSKFSTSILQGAKIIETNSHPIRVYRTPHIGPTHHIFLGVDRVEGLWKDKKSQFGECFDKQQIIFLIHPTHAHSV